MSAPSDTASQKSADNSAPDLPSTARREKPGGDYLPSTFTVSKRWLAEHQLKVLCIVVAILSPVLSLWFSTRIVGAVKQATWTLNLDDSGSFTWAPVEIADPNSKLFREVAMQAAEAYLKRNPSGLSYPEIAVRYYTPEVMQSIEREVAAQATDRKRRNLFDQVEFSEQPTRIDPSSMRYRVVGFIVRSGVLDGLAQRDVGHFRMGVELKPQTQIREKGRFPFQVVQYRISISWTGSGKVEEFASLPINSGGGKK